MILIPRWPAAQCGTDRFDVHLIVLTVLGGIAIRHDQRGRPVDRNVAVEQAQRRGNHPRAQIVVQRER